MKRASYFWKRSAIVSTLVVSLSWMLNRRRLTFLGPRKLHFVLPNFHQFSSPTTFPTVQEERGESLTCILE